MPLQAAYGQEWTTSASTSVSSTYETNPELAAQDESSNTTYLVNPSIISRLELPVSSIDFNADATITRSRDQTIQPDAREYNIGAGVERVFDSSTVSVEGDISLEEFANSGFDEAQALSAVDATQANEDDTIVRLDLGMRYQGELSESLSLLSTVDLSKAEFSDPDRTDFEDIRANSRFDRDLSDRLTVSVDIGIQYFTPEDLAAVKVGRVAGGFAYDFGDNNSVTILAGIAATKDRKSITLDASYEQPFEFFDLVATATNDVQADDDGELNETTRADVTVTRPLSEATNLQASLAVTKTVANETLLANSTLSHDYSDAVRASVSGTYRFTSADGGDTTQIVVAPTLTWAMNEELDAVFRYDEILQTQQDQDTAESRRGTITLNYNLPPF